MWGPSPFSVADITTKVILRGEISALISIPKRLCLSQRKLHSFIKSTKWIIIVTDSL